MLTNDLLEVKVSGRILKPEIIVVKSSLQLDKADILLRMFTSHKGKSLGELKCETSIQDYRLRGQSQNLERLGEGVD